jgi:hypothetical protein
LNLQHWIGQHPTAFAAIFPIYCLSLWLLIGAIISFIGGWFSLAKVYRTRLPLDGAKCRMQSGQMRRLTNYNNVLTLGVSPEGRYLAIIFLFRFMHPPLLVPWSEIRVRRKEGLGVRIRDLRDGARPGHPFCGFAGGWRRRSGNRLEAIGPWRTCKRKETLCLRCRGREIDACTPDMNGVLEVFNQTVSRFP